MITIYYLKIQLINSAAEIKYLIKTNSLFFKDTVAPFTLRTTHHEQEC
jgi:hypothetical protein